MKILYVLIPCESSKFCFKCPFESSNVSDFQTLKSLLKINKKQSGPSKDNDDDDAFVVVDQSNSSHNVEKRSQSIDY